LIPRGSSYYNASYIRVIRLKDSAVWSLMRERCTKIAPHAQGETVLDVACGLGLLADHFSGHYTGIDFSTIAIEYARSQCSTAEFIEADVFEFLERTNRCFDTVILRACMN
jgi:ubiquinone/menaquinone biosynthesis C-methylase UbiE